MVDAGFRATTDETEIATAATVVICVPTPLSEDGGPDLRAVDGATGAVARHLRAGMLVVLESTTYPGTTDEVVRPILEAVRPARRRRTSTSPSRPSASTRATRRTACATRPRSSAAYTAGLHRRGPRPSTAGSSTPSCRTKGTREAEMAKLLENTYRHVNIALVNEMARFCHELGIDLWDVIRGRGDQAVRLPGLLPRPGRRRALHPDRPELPVATTCAPSSATRSASWSWPRRSTPPCRRTWPTGRRTCSTRPAWPTNGVDGADARRHLQAQHRRPARVAGRAAGAPAHRRSARR